MMQDRERDLSVLPKWAQRLIERQRIDLHTLSREKERLQQAHAILQGREWFTIPGPPDDLNWPDKYSLWYLNRDQPMPACTLFVGDVLLVGRADRGLYHAHTKQAEPTRTEGPKIAPGLSERYLDPHTGLYCRLDR